MTRTICISALAAGIACATALWAQSGRNSELRQRIESENETIDRLVRSAPDQLAGPVTALPYDEPAAGSTAAAVASLRANTTPQQRIGSTVSRIELLTADIGDVEDSPAELFRALPDILRLVQDLSLQEMIEVADAIDAPLSSNRPTPKGIMKLILYMLAAEQDPVPMLENKELMADQQLRASIIASLSRRDPAAAERWMEQSDMSDDEKTEFHALLTFRTLRSNPRAGLEMLRNAEEEGSDLLKMFREIPFPVNKEEELLAELDRPENADLRPHLVEMIVQGAMFEGGVEAARAKIAEIELPAEDVVEFLDGSLNQAIRSEPEATLAWMQDVVPADKLRVALPTALEAWANDDFNAAGEWLGKMESSPLKDIAVSTYAHTVSQINPPAATAWAAEIQNPELRMDTLRQTVQRWRDEEPEAADAWLKERDIKL